jgi:hypothetical protein
MPVPARVQAETSPALGTVGLEAVGYGRGGSGWT